MPPPPPEGDREDDGGDPYASSASDLPVTRYASEIVEAVRANPVVVVIGETGSGKTTQISQILHRANLSSSSGDNNAPPSSSSTGIVVTQPRRVAAVSVARRVAHEMNVPVGGLVGYTVRFEDCSGRDTRIKYVTDGTLLRECLEDPSLSKYGVVILDEAHERSLNTDVLFGLLKLLVRTRKPTLKLVITSATLESEKFSAYFGDCPVYHVPGRVFPVDIAYASERPRSYLETAIETTWDLHRSQGPGDILLFLTGQEEIESACKRLNERVRDADETECDDAQILPLYAALPPEAQARVFCAPPRACRRIVVATNIAETSLTVPGVVFVVDPGVVKQNVYDPETGCDALKITAVSAVQARQRAGRAGRTQPGRCFRLYTRDAFEHDMPIVTVPEIQRTSLVGVVLYLKMLRIKGLSVLDFDFLDKPDGAAMTDALRQLYVLGAIDVDGEITEMGREMSPLPVEPQLARAMLEARRRGIVEEMATVAAMLSVERVFVGGSGGGKGQGQGQGQGRDGRDRDRPPPIASADETKMGDHVVLLRTYEAWARGGHRRRFCEEHGLNDRGMEFARDVRKQLLGVFRDRDRDRDMDRGNGDRDGGNGDGDGGRGGKRDRDGVEKNQTQTQRRGDVTDLRKAICVGFANKLARRLPRHNGFRTFGADASMIAEAHPSVARSLADDVTGLLPEWVVFHSLVSTTRPFIKGVCRIEPEWAAQVMPRLGDVDVGRLSGGALAEERTGANAEKAAAAAAEAEAERTREASGRKNTDQAVEDARARYLARKNKAAAKKS